MGPGVLDLKQTFTAAKNRILGFNFIEMIFKPVAMNITKQK